MTSLHVVSFADTTGSENYSHITDLAIIADGAGSQLFSSTRYDGVLQQWDSSSGTIAAGDSVGFGGDLILGGSSGVGQIAVGGATAVLTGGAAGGGLQLVTLNNGGAIAGTTALDTLPDIFDGLQHTTTVTLPDSTQVVFGALAGSTGIGRLRFDANGTLIEHAVVQDPTVGTASQITGMTSVEIDGQMFLLSTSNTQNGMTTRLIGADGTLTGAQSVGTDDGLWINGPSALATATVGDTTYAIVGSAGTDSLSVVEVGPDGSMIVRDHLLDTRDTRFAGVTSIEIVESDGKTYVIVAGSDDGVSVLMLLEGGLLIHRDHIEDTVDISLDNVSAIAGHSRASGIDVFAASSSETGVTQLRYDTGPAGITATATLMGGILAGTAGVDVLQGHNGSDMINAGAGDDILRDGGGVDVLTGGAGADVFILSADGETDTITDFTLGEDTLDLSLWPMLRDISQLFISLRPDGMQITYGDEILIVQSADGDPIDYRGLTNEDVIGGTRFPTILEPGYPGPQTPVSDPSDPTDPVPGQGNPYSAMTPLQIIAAVNLMDLRTAMGDGVTALPDGGMMISGTQAEDVLVGSNGFDLIIAGAGNDTASGQAGDDVILGRGGDDIVSGGDGADTLYGGDGRDTLIGGHGHDRLDGGDMSDTLNGGNGDDVLTGGDGADTFVFNAGNDQITDFTSGTDQILLDASLWTGLTSPADLLMLYGQINDDGAIITFDNGATLFIDGITDLSILADDITLF